MEKITELKAAAFDIINNLENIKKLEISYKHKLDVVVNEIKKLSELNTTLNDK